MYEVFINEYLIVLTNEIRKETDFKIFLLENFSIRDIIKQLRKGRIKEAHIYHPDVELLLRKFKRSIPAIVAAGGLVKNKRNEILFIYRNGKWDLPKGKVNRKETTEEAALREVEEETGIKGLVIDRFARNTYHIFKNKNNGRYQFKETYWYMMHSDYEGELVPETKEGIEEAVWKKGTQIKKALENSYRNIEKLLEEYH